jgi:hypothetical protein
MPTRVKTRRAERELCPSYALAIPSYALAMPDLTG